MYKRPGWPGESCFVTKMGGSLCRVESAYGGDGGRDGGLRGSPHGNRGVVYATVERKSSSKVTSAEHRIFPVEGM